ncbi:MAG: tRNA pseudouridine(38-40) synthase TruA [Leptospiraceae bacterium]|nr:tRNA pseudouridine(38-40) synthase TruA [Leptospiraceae bacterium]MCK6381003.1 tRNA pseudouridine(38-40) synthase TruA [Leptospiraceae bacterium]NUM40243.1 tRNA pseudouridine(38-40) synthase TruA [Leptospiraceae bacterium]
MPVYSLLLEYEGSRFHGFQKQTEIISVQSVLENSILIVLKEEVKIFSSGRTDTGVHSKGIIASFHSKNRIDNFYKFIKAINHLSGGSLSIHGMKEVPEKFNAQYSCTEREYEYWVFLSKYPSPLLKGRAYHYKHKLDIKKIQDECSHLLGSHDFTSFAKPSSLLKKSPIRNISKIEFRESKEIHGLYRLTIRSTGFLHNMVRIITGTLLDIGNGKIKDRNIREILQKKNRIYAGATIPPDGLYFVKAFYEKFPEIEELYKEFYKINEI